MRTTGVPVLVLAALAGGTLSACNLMLGLGKYDFEGAGGTSSSTSSTGGDGGPQPDGGAEAEAEAGPTSRGIWSESFGSNSITASVKALAVGKNGHVFVTGRGSVFNGLNCPSPTMNDGAEAFLLELDGTTGACVWGFFFGGDAAGTGVALDANGNIALTGYFQSTVTLSSSATWTAPTTQTDSFVALFAASSSSSPDHSLLWAAHITDALPTMATGDKTTTGIAVSGSTLAVSGTYSGTLNAVLPTTNKVIAGSADGQDAFVLLFDTSGQGSFAGDFEVGSTSGLPQLGNGVSMDPLGDVALVGTTTGSTAFNGNPPVSTSGTPDVFLAAYTSDIKTKAQVIFSGDGMEDGHAVAFDGAGDMVVGGTFSGNVSLPAQGADAGATYKASSGGSVILARYDLGGASLASLPFGSDTASDHTTVAGLAPFGSGTSASVAFAGGFSGKAHFPDGTSVTNPDGKTAVYVAKVDGALSKALWLESYGDGTSNQMADAIAVDPSDGSILVAGHFQGTLDFGTTHGPLTNTTGTDQLFLAKLMP